MAEPFSVATGVIATTGAILKTSHALMKLIDDVRGASGQLRSMERDVQAFHAVVHSLDLALNEEDFRSVIGADDTMIGMISNLAYPLQNCQRVLESIMNAVKRLRHAGQYKGRRIQQSQLKVRWASYAKREMHDLQFRLEANKSTLGSALDALTLMFTMRLITRASSFAAPCTSPSAIVASTQESRQGVAPRLRQIAAPTQKGVVDSGAALANETRHPLISDDPVLHHEHARIYHGRRADSQGMRQVTQSARSLNLSNPDSTSMATRRTYNAHQSSLSEIGNEDDDISVASSGAVDHFFDCVSRFSTDTSDQSVNFLGRPVALPCQYAFETSQEFYPEQYTSDTLGQSRICVVAIKRTLSMRPMVKFFLVFSETRRRMRRVVVSATFSDLRKHEAILQVWAPDSQERGLKYLPSPLKPLLINLVLGLPSSSMVANLSVAFREDDSGQMLLDSHRLKTEDDTLETQLSDHARMMRDIDDLGCPQVLESEVAILKHLHSAVYEVFVGSALYLEQKAPFASGGREGENRFLDCFEDMKMLIAMRDCSGVSRFIGVVLDDNRRRLEGYLLERPVLWSIEDVIHKANALQETIPSGLRLHWACQVVRIILELHERGIVVGKVTLQSFGIREDGSAVLCHVASSSKHLENSRGLMPPELRVAPGSSCERPPGDFNFKTDIFQLGYVLWQLIEHVKPWQGYFCDLLRCQSFPRYQCDAVHANPVQLPSCSSLVPSYYEAFMEKCRLADPTRRSSAQDLRELLRLMDDCEMYVPNVRELFSRYQDSSFKYYEVTCIECNKVIDDLCYHCNSCNEADFDLCSECFGRGVRCWSPEHSLIKLREGEEVQEAS